MRYEICFLLLVSVCLCEGSNNVTKSVVKSTKHHHTNKTNNCKRLNCPTTEELKCIKLKNKKANNTKEIHIIVLNRCEIDYIKCHDGLEATIVPMKNCDKQTVGNSDKKRPKRSPKIAITSKNNITLKSRRHKIPLKSNKIDYSKLYFGPQRRDISEDIVEEEPEEGSGSLSGEVVEEINVSVQGNLGEGEGEMMSFRVEGGDNENNSSEEHESNDDESDDQENIDDEESSGDGSYDDHEASDDVSEMNVSLHVKQDELKDSKSEEPEAANTGSEETKIEVSIDPKMQELSPESGQVMGTSIEVDRNDIEVHKTDVEDSTESDDVIHNVETPETPDSSDSDVNAQDVQNGECPTECPARDVMVCARCRAGVYRTFLSVCHLRLFSCNHPEEKLELVTRRPCVLSAPFLTGMKTKGRQKDPNDEDVVLKYIRCREKGNTNDSKCKFAKDDNKPRLRKKI